jgi:hypothetical protein
LSLDHYDRVLLARAGERGTQRHLEVLKLIDRTRFTPGGDLGEGHGPLGALIRAANVDLVELDGESRSGDPRLPALRP